MTATFSVYALEAMGFRELIDKGDLKASFMSVTVYEARGVGVPEAFVHAREARVAGATYRVAVAKDLNVACRALIGDEFAESEDEWRKEVKSNGPFVLVAVGPTDFIDCEAGRMMLQPNGDLITYDSFGGLRDVLKALEQRVLPLVVASLTLSLSEPDRQVSLRKLTRTSAGRTPEGKTVHDVRLDFRAELIVSRNFGEAKVTAMLDAAVNRAPKLNQRAARYFGLGTAEDDQLKKFLYFFLSLEVETHAVFGRIDHVTEVRALLSEGSVPQPLPNVLALFARDVAGWENLFDRFAWCASCVWTHIAEDDISLFKRLKSARDSIAHGRTAEPPTGFAYQAEQLAHKVLWAQ